MSDAIAGDPLLERMQALCARITYKPGAAVHAYDGDCGSILFDLTMPVTCSRTGEPTVIGRGLRHPRQLLGSLSDPELARYIVRQLIRLTEDHEIDEWLRLDGEHVQDPHASTASTDAAIVGAP